MSFGVTAFRFRRCWSTLKLCTRPSRTISNSPSMAPSKSSASTRSGKGARDVLAGAGVDPPHRSPVAALARRRPEGGCRPISTRPGTRRLRAWRNPRPPEGARAWRAKRGGIAGSRASAPCLRPRRTGLRRAPPARARSARPRRARSPPSWATAVLASRAETPTRSSRVISLMQRPASRSRREHPASRRPAPAGRSCSWSRASRRPP